MVEPIKFLLVDDTPENLVALEALLRRDGLELLLASSGSEALELLLVHDVALALVDVQMPVIDGFELAELMRGTERTRRVPIIFVTAGARDPQRVFKGYETGAVDFLYKPIEPHVLKSKADVFFELARRNRELSEALRLNEMFVAILGHDLRNPLGALITGGDLLRQQIVDPAQVRTLGRMSSAAHRMSDMIEQLLDLTRARLAGGVGFSGARKQLSVRALVERAIEELQTTHPDRLVSLESCADTGAAGNETRLLQLFSNLLGNAIRHGEPKAPITVRIRGDENELLVEVANGGTIAPSLLPAIFEPFRGRKTDGPSGGLGLGLFISRQIALAQGGDISVESTTARGTRFTVRLPRHRDRGPVLATAKKSVLIVEDEEHIRESLREILEDEGYTVTTASNGQEALDVLADTRSKPSVVILDIVMPVMDGRRVYQAMRENPELADIPVIVSTSNPANAPPGLVVVLKPFKLERLLDLVSKLSGRSA